MRLLLDTHIFLWYVSEPHRLSPAVRAALQHLSNELFLSVSSVWEVITKYQIGKLSLPEPPEVYLPRMRARHQILSLPLDEGSAFRLTRLPLIHRDPFDQILICQTLEHGLTLVTTDPVVLRYPVPVLAA
jgi:PIN domain nuclease of toxin-antitoxin system